jgi:hypothetical protein
LKLTRMDIREQRKWWILLEMQEVCQFEWSNGWKGPHTVKLLKVGRANIPSTSIYIYFTTHCVNPSLAP